jgi:hypothetical protein
MPSPLPHSHCAVLTAGFILEFVVKHLGCGIVGYWRDPWNILDGLIVVLSIVRLGYMRLHAWEHVIGHCCVPCKWLKERRMMSLCLY